MGNWVCRLAPIVGPIIGNAITGTTKASFMIDNNSQTSFGAPTTETSTNIERRPWIEAWVNGTSAFTTVGP